ncbi:FTR1 family iron permease [Paucibacter soli]|uniref:FTR1 family iron permease n=1 Tax=Paucibacter soli TaxID=3133433 RepID=UPI0030961C9D
MFSATLIVFRESLEAALFVGIVAAATRQMAGRTRWLGAGVALGVLGAVLLALLAERISGLFDGLGQDLVNVGVLSLALLMLLWHCIWVSFHSREFAAEARQLGESVQQRQGRPWPLLVAVALAVLREGAETVLFVAGSVTGDAAASTQQVLLSSLLGLVLGALLGFIMYAGLARIPARRLFAVTNYLIALLAGSIASQLARALSQAGLLEVWVTPLWDSSSWLAPDSSLGTLAHALVGYDAQPSGAQLASYLAVLALIYAGSKALQLRAAAAP